MLMPGQVKGPFGDRMWTALIKTATQEQRAKYERETKFVFNYRVRPVPV